MAPSASAARQATPRSVHDRLLAWYDRHARALPWRATGGARPDPYRVWLSEVMLQQTTVAAAIPYFERFVARWPRVRDLAAAPLDDVLAAWAGLGYYARARNLHACARAVCAGSAGRFPQGESELRGLPGIGPYTAAAIAAIAYDARACPVDGNVERVVARLFGVETALPAAKPELRRLAERLLPEPARLGFRYGDLAQAMMDLGATVCLPRRPRCGACPLAAACAARAAGRAEALPRQAPKTPRPTRRGVAFWTARRDGTVLLRRRPARGLLGGMLEVPSTDWRPEAWARSEALAQAPLPARWTRLPGLVRHTFTHFRLELAVWVTAVDEAHGPEAGQWVRLDDLAGQALPSVMRKVVRHALAGAGAGGTRGR